jgi:hypothetical protein
MRLNPLAALLMRACCALATLLVGSSAARAADDGAAARLKDLLDMRPGEWRELPNTRMDAVFPKRDETTWGVQGPGMVVLSRGGAAYDTRRNAFVFNGGGSTAYGGNEVYAFFLEALNWQRLTQPSPMRRLESRQYVTTDGTPVSAQTYGGLAYLPNVDRIFRNGGGEFGTGKNYDRSAWLFDMGERRWERKSAGGGGNVVTAYDRVRQTLYVIGPSYVDEYDAARDVWKRRQSARVRIVSGVGAIDPQNRRLVVRSARPGVVVYEIGRDGSVGPGTLSKTQGAIEWDSKMLALEYDPVREVLVAWAGDRDTAYLDGRTLLWRRFANSDGAAAPQRVEDHRASRPIFGRWRYVPKYDVFISYDHPRGNVWVWKPVPVAAGDSGPPPAGALPTIRPLLTRLQPGQTVVLPPGVYREAATIKASNVVIKAHGVRLEHAAAERKAALVVKGDNVTIEGLECAYIKVPDRNGACVRLEAKNLTLRNVHFRDSQSGLLAWKKDSGTVLIENSRFERIGRVHGVYIGRGDTHLIVRNSWFLSSRAEGHEIKSRAAKNTIERNVIASLDGVDSRLIDLPEGGENVIRGNVLAKGPASSNQDLIGVALERNRELHSVNSTVIEDNIIIMERRGTNVLLHQRRVPEARIERNKVIGGKNPGGDNTWFPDRAAAGLPKYPALPEPRSVQ